MTLRQAMLGREGTAGVEQALRLGLRAWAVERHSDHARRQTAIVFGRSRSDALRRASAPARMGEEIHGDVTVAVEIPLTWDDPVVWPEMEAAPCP